MGHARAALGCKYPFTHNNKETTTFEGPESTNLILQKIYASGFQPSSDWRYPPVVGEQGYVGSATSWASAGRVSTFNPARHNASDTFAFPLRDQTRNALVTGSFTSTFYWFGQLADGTMVRPGNYT